MTKLYNRLSNSPQLTINRGALSPAERMQLRKLQVSRSSDVPPEYDGQFTTVFYLEADERAVARRFVEENREQLEAIFSHSLIQIWQCLMGLSESTVEQL